MTTSPAPLVTVTATYRYLRLILPVLVFFIAFAGFFQARRSGFTDSISDYYGGPVRDVFVGGLIAAGVCLVVYKGSGRLEDYSLNFAGFSAIIVALVPNTLAQQLETLRTQYKDKPLELSDAETAFFGDLRASMIPLLVAATAFLILDYRFMHRSSDPNTKLTSTAQWLAGIAFAGQLLLVLAILLMLMRIETILGASTFKVVHLGAAVMLILNLMLCVASNTWTQKLRPDYPSPENNRVHRFYAFVVIMMAVGIVFGAVTIPPNEVPVLPHWQYAVIAVEYWEILWFVAFWIVATRESWRIVAKGQA